MYTERDQPVRVFVFDSVADVHCRDSRELVHQFRQRTLVLLKALILQKKVCLSLRMSLLHTLI